jgi:hypothetical protein
MHYVFNPDHYIGIVIANTTLLYKCIWKINIIYLAYREETVEEKKYH